MASFVRRLFGGGGTQAPSKPAAPKPAPAPTTGGVNAPAQGAPAATGGGTGTGAGRARPKGRTVYTSSLGLSPADRSGINLKTLTGM